MADTVPSGALSTSTSACSISCTSFNSSITASFIASTETTRHWYCAIVVITGRRRLSSTENTANAAQNTKNSRNSMTRLLDTVTASENAAFQPPPSLLQ